MSRGFDLIRRHLVGRKAAEQGLASSAQGSTGSVTGDAPARGEAAMAADFRRDRAAAPPPFDPVRVAATPPPLKSARPKSTLPKETPPAPTPSQTLRHRQLPEVLRPPIEAAGETAPAASVPVPPGAATAVHGKRSDAERVLTENTGPANPAQPRAAAPPPKNQPPEGSAPPGTPQLQSNRPVSERGGNILPQRRPVAPQPRTSVTTPPGTTRIDKTNARAARRHSVFVALMKGLLPGLVIGLAGVFFFYTYDFRPVALPDNVEFDPGKVSVGAEGIRMVAPKLTGVDENQQTFEIKADEAIQDRADPAKVTLVGIDARVNLTDGGTIGFSAHKGVYNTDLNQIWLSESIEIRSSEGYVAQLSEAQVDFKNGLMVSNSPVLIFTNDGVINASGVQVLDGGKKVIFSGRVTLNLNGSAGETQ